MISIGIGRNRTNLEGRQVFPLFVIGVGKWLVQIIWFPHGIDSSVRKSNDR